MTLKQRYFKRGIAVTITQITSLRYLGNNWVTFRITIYFKSSKESELHFSWRDHELALRWDSSLSLKNGRAIDRNVVISGEGIEMNKASTVRGHKEGEFREHNHEFNFRYNEFAFLVRYIGVKVSQVDGSLWIVFWNNLGARDIDLRINFLRMFYKVIEVIHQERVVRI